MSDTIKALINQVIVTARHRGLTQAQLAQAAGMTAVGLSKAKHRGDIRASTLQALAEQLDLELSLTPRRSREKATRAIRTGTFFHISASPEDTGD